MAEPQVAILGGGCFWCLEAVFRQVRGVIAVEAGYCGGHTRAPCYDTVCGGRSGHAEVVRIRFDPAQVSFRQLLEVFFAIHDPASANRQGNDVGTQYRSVIVAQDTAQAACARELMAALEAAGAFNGAILTEVASGQPFWPAEARHQDYCGRHAGQPYCQFVVSPKLEKLRRRFAQLSRD
jgi:peptide-methionine (S)-S-oxide reductase